MRLRQLRHFLVFAEEKSISRAASRLCIKPSPLSHSIKKLEEQLGMPLFHRNGALRLTRAGESFALEVGRMLHAFEDAKTQAQAIAKGYGDVLRIGLADGLAHPVLIELLRLCREQTPDINIDIMEANTPHLIQELLNNIWMLSSRYIQIPQQAVCDDWRGAIAPVYCFLPGILLLDIAG